MSKIKDLSDAERILVVDDHPAVRQGIISVLRESFPESLIRAASDGGEAIREAASFRPEIIIMDISMPEMNGVEACLKIKQDFPEFMVIVYSMFSEKKEVKVLVEAGISAYILKSEPLADLVNAVSLVKNGGTYLSKGVVACLVDSRLEKPQNGSTVLSDRECEVLRLITAGLKVKEIAEELCISTKTVETHKYNMFDKLNVRTVAGLVKIALKSGLCDD